MKIMGEEEESLESLEVLAEDTLDWEQSLGWETATQLVMLTVVVVLVTTSARVACLLASRVTLWVRERRSWRTALLPRPPLCLASCF